MKRAVLLVLGVGLLTAGLSVFIQTRAMSAENISVEDVAATTSAAVGVGASFDVPGRPSTLRIPAIGVDARIQSVGLSWRGTGDMGIPSNFTDVAWYKDGPVPGAPGSAVIDGHLDGKDVAEAVFYNLDKLKPGDLVEVIDKKGGTLQFRVVETRVYDYAATTTEIFSADTAKPRLNLITCAGGWDKTKKLYEKRIVVFTELLGSR